MPFTSTAGVSAEASVSRGDEARVSGMNKERNLQCAREADSQ